MTEKRDGDREQMEQLVQALGAAAESSLRFYRAMHDALDAGADTVIKLTQAYRTALLLEGQKKPPESEEK